MLVDIENLTVKGSFFRALDRASDNAKTTGFHLVN